ncbi:MAG: manganese efflux pump [Prevotella sp.]|nr:manganese efflux pump [Prevotella sp.]
MILCFLCLLWIAIPTIVNILDLFLLGISLGMDCLAVSIANGAIVGRWSNGIVWRTSILFGAFQALMPLIGWIAARLFAARVEAYGHYIAFALLLVIGLRMAWEGLHAHDNVALDHRSLATEGTQEHSSLNVERLSTQLLLAVATSIDAMAVGISMGLTGYNTWKSLVLPLAIIGLTSLLMSLAGFWAGIRFGRIASTKIRPELFGALILVLLAVKVLLAG